MMLLMVEEEKEMGKFANKDKYVERWSRDASSLNFRQARCACCKLCSEIALATWLACQQHVTLILAAMRILQQAEDVKCLGFRCRVSSLGSCERIYTSSNLSIIITNIVAISSTSSNPSRRRITTSRRRIRLISSVMLRRRILLMCLMLLWWIRVHLLRTTRDTWRL